MLFFVLFIALALSQAPPQLTQYPPLPNNVLVLPQLNSSFHVFVSGGKKQSIANAAAVLFCQLGAHVTITTRNEKTFDRSAIDACPSIQIEELDLGIGNNGNKRAKKVAQKYIDRYGKAPDVYVNGALTIYNGDAYHYDSDDMEYVYRMSIVHPMELERVWLTWMKENPSKTMKILYISTWAAIVSPPYYQEFYNHRQQFLISRLEANNAAALFPNVEWLATLCTFTNTTAMITSQNPSADAGVCSQQQFQTIFTANLYNLGIPPAQVGKAVVQAALLRSQLNFETIFDASGPYSATTPNFIQLRATTTGKQFMTAYRGISLSGYHINITQSVCPARKRDVNGNQDDIPAIKPENIYGYPTV